MNRHVLLVSAGRRVELLQAFQHASKSLAPGTLVFCADMRPEHSAACQLADRCFALPSVSDPTYEVALSELCGTYDIGLVVPTIDTELPILAQMRDDLEQRGTKVVVSDATLVDSCRDKRKTEGLFRTLRLATPKLYKEADLQFPCFTKLYDGSSSAGAMTLWTAADLTPAMRNDPRRIYMQLVPPTYREITIDLYYDRTHTLKALVPRQRLEVRAGEVSKGITRRDWLYDYLLTRVCDIEGAVGCLTLQLFAGLDEGDVLAIEINPRFGGGYPLSLAAGADFPSWMIREYFLDQAIPFYDEWAPNLLMLRYDAKVLVHENA